MKSALIRLSYRQIIDKNISDEFSKKVLDSSWHEFNEQMRPFLPGSITTWTQIKEFMPKSIIPLEESVSRAIQLHFYGLKGNIPGLFDIWTRRNLKFEDYIFEIIDADVRNKDSYKISIIYITNPLTLIDSLQDNIFVSDENEASKKILSQEEIQNILQIKMNPEVSFFSYKSIL